MSDNKTTKINILNRLQTKINNTTSKVKLDLIGTVLLDKYTIHSKMNNVSGEAELYRCTDNNQKEYVVKIYQRENAIKPEIIEKLKSINSPNVAKIIDSGVHENYPFVILPYYSNGSLVEAVLSKGMTFDLNDIKEFVLPSLNNGLKVLHDNGIIHKDLKPSNIMISDDGTNLVIIDFGISSDTNGGTVVLTKTGMTPTYLAPEALSNTYLKETDYYALGITIYELFTGHTPYENLNEDQIASYASIQKIPYPIVFPKALKNLINGLTYKDLSNRNDKNNPNRRWIYEDVEQWLNSNGEYILTDTNSSSDNSTNLKDRSQFQNSSKSVNQTKDFLYIYKLQEYRDINLLVEQLLLNSAEGKKELARGNLSKKLRQTGEEKLARICEDAEFELQEYSDENDTDKLFLSLIYTIAPNLNKIIWNGISYSSLLDYGNALIDEVNYNNCKDTELVNSAEKFLTNGFFNIWVKNFIQEELRDSYTQIIETNKKLLISNKLAPQFNALRLGYAITGRTDFIIENKKYQSIENLEQELDSLYNSNLKQYARFIEKNCQELKLLKSILLSCHQNVISNILSKYDGLLFLNNRQFIYRGFTGLFEYSNKLLNNGELKELLELSELIKKDLEKFRLENKIQGEDINLYNKYQQELQSVIYLDDEHIYRNFDEFDRFMSDQRLKNPQFVKNFIKSRQKNILNYFNLLDNDVQIDFKNRYPEFSTIILDEIKVGNIVKFGNYFINSNQIREPIEWRVLEVFDNKALLITKDAIDCKQYNEINTVITWEKCTLRYWLNYEFINQAFRVSEQDDILLTELENPSNLKYSTNSGRPTRDKIFLLSIDEAQKYFKDNKDIECKVTDYAKQQGVWTSSENKYLGNCYWWLRSPGCYQNRASAIDYDGDVLAFGYDVNDNKRAIRPALFVNLESM